MGSLQHRSLKFLVEGMGSPGVQAFLLGSFRDIKGLECSFNPILRLRILFLFFLHNMLQSTLARLGAASCSDSLDFSLRDLGTFASMIIVVLSVLYKILYEPTLLMRKGDSPYVQSLSSVWLISDPLNKFFGLMRDYSGALLSFMSQLRPSQPKPIVLSGQEGRRIFFKEKNLHLYETFQGLFGSVSTLEATFHPIY
jgi:hypothetical protein